MTVGSATGPILEATPLLGEVVTLHVDGRQISVWWGPVGDDDRIATRAGRALTWPTADAAVEAAGRAGWQGMGAEDGDPSIGRSSLDFEPAQAWLRDRRPLDPVSALNLWNFAGDVAGSTGRTWRDRGRIADRCYDKLFAANVPWVFGRTEYRPRWTTTELGCIRRVLNDCVHLLRTELP
jgi:hypothetical protein